MQEAVAWIERERIRATFSGDSGRQSPDQIPSPPASGDAAPSETTVNVSRRTENVDVRLGSSKKTKRKKLPKCLRNETPGRPAKVKSKFTHAQQDALRDKFETSRFRKIKDFAKDQSEDEDELRLAIKRSQERRRQRDRTSKWR